MRIPLKLLSNLAEVRDEVVEEWLLANHPERRALTDLVIENGALIR
jgi:hypothetical protein